MKVCSIFSQVLKLFSRGRFREGGEGAQGRAARAGFHQLGAVHGDAVLPVGTGAFLARDLRRLACCEGQLKHLGVPVAPKKSTLAYANEHRPWELVPDGVRADAVQMPGTGAKARAGGRSSVSKTS
jgi:hypothetical protein